MSANGQFTKGVGGNPKLTWPKVGEIRRLYEEGTSQGKLARMFGVGTNQIGKIVRGESWQRGMVKEQAVAAPPSREFLEDMVELSKQVASVREEGKEEGRKPRGRFGVVDDVVEAGRELPPGVYGPQETPEEIMRSVMAERTNGGGK